MEIHRRGTERGEVVGQVAIGGGAVSRRRKCSLSMAALDESYSETRRTGGNSAAQGGAVGDETFVMPPSIGAYRIESEMGSGAQGRVWRGVDQSGSPVAIKALFHEDAVRVAELRRTFALVQQLSNSHVAAPLELIELSGKIFTVMRFAPGRPLAEWFEGWLGSHWAASAEDRLSVAIELCRQIADALDSAHRKSVMHLDVKPENIMVEDLDGGGFSVQLLDLGLARMIDPDGSPIYGVGTDEFIAPEIWIGEHRPDGRADQYSLACVLYWLLSGGTPFTGTFDAAARRLETEWERSGRRVDWGNADFRKAWKDQCGIVGKNVAARQAAASCPGLDSKRNQALLKALSKDPEKRYGTCMEMVNAVANGGSKFKMWMPPIVALAILAAGAVCLAAWQQMEEVRKESIIRIFMGKSQIGILRAKADGGDAEAIFELAERYAKGVGISKNPEEAFRRFCMAAEAGHGEAIFRAGDCLARGIGTQHNDAAAAKWFRRGAEAGNPNAVGAWAECLWEGRGIAQNKDESLKNALPIVDKAIAPAQYVVGAALVEGVGPEHNPQKGASMLKQAAESGHLAAQFALSRLYSQGKGVAPNEEAAARWSLAAARNGHVAAMLDMVSRYMEGRGVTKSASESSRWLERAEAFDSVAVKKMKKALALAEAEQNRIAEEADRIEKAKATDPFFDLRQCAEKGEAAAIFELAKRLDDGIGMRKDQYAAFRWWKILAEMEKVDEADLKRREEAWGRYGAHLYDGTGCVKDVAAAIPWLEKFAGGVKTVEDQSFGALFGTVSKTGPSEPEWANDRKQVERGKASFRLARCYDAGIGVQKNVSKANNWYEQGGEAGNSECIREFARRIAAGMVVVTETEKAVWYRRAADDGDPEAKAKLKELFNARNRRYGR